MKKIVFYTLIACCSISQILAQTPQELAADLPLVAGWKISPETEVFRRDNLYERINGAAPLFLENNFQEMTSMEYTQGNDYITIQAYRHATPEDAFGMFASERSPDLAHYEGIGGEAQGDGSSLYFFAGCMYVKMMASNESEAIAQAMQEIARSLAGKIDLKAGYPLIFQSFPEESLIPYTQAYITANYIGHEFLKPAYVADYSLFDRKVQLFVIDGQTSEGAHRILSDYFAFTKQPQDFTEGDFNVKDRYNGNLPVVWTGHYIVGAFDSEGRDFPEEIYPFLHQFNK